MKQQCRALLFSSLVVAAGFASAAGTVSVSFIDASKYWDAGTTPWDEAANLVSLAEHLQALGKRHLREGEVLKIEVFDVDLAGTTRPWRGSASDMRIARGGADWPRIGLRYTLEVNGTPVRRAEESVINMNYTRGLVEARYSEPLYHEKKMLEKWFKASFVEGRAAAD